MGLIPLSAPVDIDGGTHIPIFIYTPSSRKDLDMSMKERYIHTGYYKYMERNIGRGWRQFLRTTDSVTVLIYINDLDRFVLVQQPRESLIDAAHPEGTSTECIGGRFDYDVDPLTLVINEAVEEAGVHLTPADIVPINGGKPMTVSPGATTERCYLYYAVVHSSAVDMSRTDFGADGEDERITRILVTPDQLARDGCDDLRVYTLYQYHLLQHQKGATA